MVNVILNLKDYLQVFIIVKLIKVVNYSKQFKSLEFISISIKVFC